jgi:hypothetical protein
MTATPRLMRALINVATLDAFPAGKVPEEGEDD